MKAITRFVPFLLPLPMLACGAEAPSSDNVSSNGSPTIDARSIDPNVVAPARVDRARVSTDAAASTASAAGQPLDSIGRERARELATRIGRSKFAWEHDCALLDHHPDAPPARTLSLLPGDAEDGTTVTDTDWRGTARQLRHFNGKNIALRLYQAELDRVGIGRVRNFIEELDVLYAIKKEFVGLEPNGVGRTVVVAVPAVEDVCAGGYACAYQNTRTVWTWSEALTDQDAIGALSHELNHAFDRLSAHLFTSADSAHSWTEVLDTMTFVYLQRDDNAHYNAQGISPTDNLRYRRWERLSAYENFPGGNWTNCVNVEGCDPLGDASAQGLSVHAQAGVALRVFELYGSNTPFKRWFSEAQSLATSRAYGWDSLTREQRREFLLETLSRAAQANLSCFFDGWNWPVSTTLRNSLTSLYGATNAYCNDSDGDGFTRHRHDCNDSSASVRPNATETTNSVDDDCDDVVDDIKVTESGDFPSDQASALTVPLPVRISGNVTGGDRDSFRINIPSPRTVRLYVRSLGPSAIVDVFNQGSLDAWTAFDVRSWNWNVYKVNLNAGQWDFRIYGHNDGPYEMFVQNDTSLPVQPLDSWPTTYTPAVAANPAANQYVIPAPPIPSALTGTPNLQVRHFVSNFGIVGTTAATSSFTWNAPAGTNPKGLQYRSEFVTSTSGPPVWPLSQYQSLVALPTFTSQDIGTVSTPGLLRSWFDNFTVEAAGSGITGSADSFRYSWVKVSGNAEIVARVVNLENTNSNALAGVAIRENLNANARNAVFAVTPSDTLRFQRRTSAGGSTSSTSATQSNTTPRWLRLVRSGNTFSAYRSTNGTSWTQVGSNTNITMGTTVYVGVAATSASAANLATGIVDAVNVTGTIVP